MMVVFYVYCLLAIEMMINATGTVFSLISLSCNVLDSLFTYQKGKC